MPVVLTRPRPSLPAGWPTRECPHGGELGLWHRQGPARARGASRAATVCRCPGDIPPGSGSQPPSRFLTCALTDAGQSGALFPPGYDRTGGSSGLPGHPGLAGKTSRVWRLLRCPCPLPAAVRPHRRPSPIRITFEYDTLTWSPVTESNRRPSPYHKYVPVRQTRDLH